MKNSFNSISFIIPFLTIILLITFIVPSIPGIENGVIFFTTLVFLVVILFPLLQGLIRYLYFKQFNDKNNFFFALNLGESKLYQRIMYYLLVFLVLIYPIIGRELNFNRLVIINIIITILFIILSEIMLYLTFSKTNINFMKNGILIIGYDFRIDLPVVNSIKSNSGFYSYDDFTCYSLKNNILTLYINENDKIKAKLVKELEPQVLGFLITKKIELKK